jgi:acetyl-CoA carboxylase biotin carboxyl carrier protein
MTPDDAFVATLRRWLEATDIDQLELTGPSVSLLLRRAGGGAAPLAAGPALVEVRAASPGLFLDRHPLSGRPLVETGEEVAAGDDLGCLRVGALLLPVRAPQAGLVAARPCTPGTLVGYGDTLFRLRPLPPGDAP